MLLICIGHYFEQKFHFKGLYTSSGESDVYFDLGIWGDLAFIGVCGDDSKAIIFVIGFVDYKSGK